MSTGIHVPLTVRGRATGTAGGPVTCGQTTLDLRGDRSANPRFGGVRLRLGLVTYPGGIGEILKVDGKAFGQRTRWKD